MEPEKSIANARFSDTNRDAEERRDGPATGPERLPFANRYVAPVLDLRLVLGPPRAPELRVVGEGPAGERLEKVVQRREHLAPLPLGRLGEPFDRDLEGRPGNQLVRREANRPALVPERRGERVEDRLADGERLQRPDRGQTHACVAVVSGDVPEGGDRTLTAAERCNERDPQRRLSLRPHRLRQGIGELGTETAKRLGGQELDCQVLLGSLDQRLGIDQGALGLLVVPGLQEVRVGARDQAVDAAEVGDGAEEDVAKDVDAARVNGPRQKLNRLEPRRRLVRSPELTGAGRCRLRPPRGRRRTESRAGPSTSRTSASHPRAGKHTVRRVGDFARLTGFGWG